MRTLGCKMKQNLTYPHMKHLKSTRKALTAATALLLATGAPMLQSCEKDILTGQPS